MNSGFRLLAPALATLCLMTFGCDKKTELTRPVPTTEPTLDSVWPNADSLSWRYRIAARWWDDVGPRHYQSPDSVPPVPPLTQLALRLGTQPIGATPATDTATFQLRFEGIFTTLSGVTAQRLTETILRPRPPLPTRILPFGGAAPGGLLRDLAIARPALAARLGVAGLRSTRTGTIRALVPPDTVIGSYPTLFLFGYAYRKTSEWIGSYGDADTALAWKYLVKNLAPGSEFAHQLVPSLANDIVLRGRILNRQTIQTIEGTYANVVVCLYSVDYGVEGDTDDQGNLLGYVRYYSYGTVAYADSVGPIASYERRMVGVGSASLGNMDQDLSLSSRNFSSPAMLRAGLLIRRR